MEDKDFLTVKDVSKILQITERTCTKLFRDGVIKSKKVANKYITTRDILKKFIEEDEENEV